MSLIFQELPTQLWAVEVACGKRWLLFKVYQRLEDAEAEARYFTHSNVRVRQATVTWNRCAS